jgi:D-lyxose ketol-isomerase
MLRYHDPSHAARSDVLAHIHFDNAPFYAAGRFDPEVAKEAYLALMAHHGYPVFRGLRERLVVSDFGLGEFACIGLGSLFFLNEERGGYCARDLFLLPHQMMPEHYHVATATAPAKLEGWVVRYGVTHVYDEGPDTGDLYAHIPADEARFVMSHHEARVLPGEGVGLTRPAARHWQFAGPEGAIVTECGTFHDESGVRYTDPRIMR